MFSLSLPPDIDVLFVPVGLVEAALQVAPAVRGTTLTASTSQLPAYNEFVQQLKAGEVLYAQRVMDAPDPWGSRGGINVRYKGNVRIG